jgi:hypothetical protein
MLSRPCCQGRTTVQPNDIRSHKTEFESNLCEYAGELQALYIDECCQRLGKLDIFVGFQRFDNLSEIQKRDQLQLGDSIHLFGHNVG